MIADATPVRKIPLNKVPFVPNNEPLLGILDKFQEGRSHMAIVSRFSVERAASVKKAVKRGLTQRLLDSVRWHLRNGSNCDLLLLGVAAWMRYVGGVDEQGAPIEIRDPLKAELAERVAASGEGEARVK